MSIKDKIENIYKANTLEDCLPQWKEYFETYPDRTISKKTYEKALEYSKTIKTSNYKVGKIGKNGICFGINDSIVAIYEDRMEELKNGKFVRIS